VLKVVWFLPEAPDTRGSLGVNEHQHVIVDHGILCDLEPQVGPDALLLCDNDIVDGGEFEVVVQVKEAADVCVHEHFWPIEDEEGVWAVLEDERTELFPGDGSHEVGEAGFIDYEEEKQGSIICHFLFLFFG
jgi:hypothetical protein